MSDIFVTNGQGRSYRVWESFDLINSLDSPVNELTLTNNEGSFFRDEQWYFETQEKISLHVSGIKLFEGYVYVHEPAYSKNRFEVKLKCKSKIYPITQGSVISETGVLNGSVIQIAEKLCEPYDIGIINKTQVNLTDHTYNVDLGSTVYSVLKTLSNRDNVLITNNSDGNLVFFDLPKEGSAIRKKYGLSNNESARARFDYTMRYSEYHIRGQSDQRFNVEDSSDVNIKAVDPKIKVHMPIIIQPQGRSTKDSVRKRALWQRSRDLGDSIEVSIVVPGFTDKNGDPWEAGKLIYVELPHLRLAREMLISTVSFSLNPKGQETELTMKLPESYSAKPELKTLSRTSKTGYFDYEAATVD